MTHADTSKDNDKDNFLDEALEQIQEEHKVSLNFVQTKRNSFRERLRLYNNQRKQKDKIGITLLYTLIQTLLGLSHTDRLDIRFNARNLTGNKISENQNKLAKFDYDEMNLADIDYRSEWDRFFYGVSIKVMDSWNDSTKTPVAKVIDPLAWYPDPNASHDIDEFRFMGFESIDVIDNLTEDRGFFNINQIERKKLSSEQLNTEAQRSSAFGYSQTDLLSNETGIIDWFTTIFVDGVKEKWHFTVANDFSLIIRANKIKPVLEEEKKDPSLIPFPVALSWYSPVRGDPFGVSVGDLAEDKQRASSILANLRIASAQARLYPMYLYDKNKIRNRTDLSFGFNKGIAVNGDPVGAIQPMAKDFARTNDAINNEQSLERESRAATGIDVGLSGILSAQDRTLGEVENTQANANIRQALHNKLKIKGTKHFWFLWQRTYRQFMSDKKEVRITNATGSTYQVFKRKDFIGKQDPDIEIVSAFESAAKKAREAVSFASILPLLLQDDSIPTASKNFAKRHLLTLHNIDTDKINVMIPPSSAEIQAQTENELIADGQEVKVKADDDHATHDVVHALSEQSEEMVLHRSLHQRIIARLPQNQAPAVSPQTANIAQAQIGSQASASTTTAPQSPDLLSNNQ